MKSRKSIVSIAFIIMVLILGLSSCSSSKRALLGKWEFVEGRLDIEGVWNDLEIIDKPYYNHLNGKLIETFKGSGTLEFKKDGSYLFETNSKLVSNPYSISEGNLVVLYNENIGNTYIFNKVDDILELTMGNDTAYFQKTGGGLEETDGIITVVLTGLFLFILSAIVCVIVVPIYKNQVKSNKAQNITHETCDADYDLEIKK